MAEKTTFIIKTNSNEHFSIDLKIPDIEVKLTEVVPQLYGLFDKIIDIRIRDKNITCQKGCGICCRQLIPLSVLDIFYLNHYVSSLTQKKQRTIRKKFTSKINIIKDAGLLPGLQNPRQYKDIETDYFNLGIKCPFLENGSCSIYKYRPFVCREYLVSSSKDFCADLSQEKIERVRIKENIGPMLAAFFSRLYGISRDPVPLILSLSSMGKYKDIEEKKWPGIWIFDRIIESFKVLHNSDEDFFLIKREQYD